MPLSIRSKRLLYLLVVIATVLIAAVVAPVFIAFVRERSPYRISYVRVPGLKNASRIGVAQPRAGPEGDWVVCIVTDNDLEYWTQKGANRWAERVPKSAEDFARLGKTFRLPAGSTALVPAPPEDWAASLSSVVEHPEVKLSQVSNGARHIPMPDMGQVQTGIESYGKYPSWIGQVGQTRFLASWSEHSFRRQDNGNMVDSYHGTYYYEIFLPPYTRRTGPPLEMEGPHLRMGASAWTPDGQILILVLDDSVGVLRITDLPNLSNSKK